MSSLGSPSQFDEFVGKRFLFAAGNFNYFGGAERQSVYFAEYLIRYLNADVKFIGWGGDGRFADEIRRVGAIPIVFSLKSNLNFLNDRLQLLKLAKFIRYEISPNYLLPYVATHCRIIGSAWPWTGVRFCWWNQRDEGRDVSGSRLERRLMKKLPTIISNSWEGKDFLTKRFQLSESRVRIINNGVELPLIHKDLSWRKSAGISPTAFVITMLANLTKFKDHTTLLKAFSEVTKSLPSCDLHLVFAGNHYEESTNIKALAWDLGLSGRLHLPGAVKDTVSLLRSTDLVVHSSTTEGCPNGALEAMAHGLPVLGTNIAGMRQALGNNRAPSCLAAPHDWQGLANRIAHRIENHKLRQEEGAENRERIQREFSIESMSLKSLEAIQHSDKR